MAWRGWSRWILPESVRWRLRVPRFAVEILVALSLASLVWLYLRTRDHESLDHVPVPVQITLAPDCAETIMVAAAEGLTLLWPDLDKLADESDSDLAHHAREAVERLCEDMDRRHG